MFCRVRNRGSVTCFSSGLLVKKYDIGYVLQMSEKTQKKTSESLPRDVAPRQVDSLQLAKKLLHSRFPVSLNSLTRSFNNFRIRIGSGKSAKRSEQISLHSLTLTSLDLESKGLSCLQQPRRNVLFPIFIKLLVWV